MKQHQLETIVEDALNLFSPLLDIDDIKWDFAILSEESSMLNKNVCAVLIDENKLIINPEIEDTFKTKNLSEKMLIVFIYGKIAHEVRHRWQKLQNNKSWKMEYKNYVSWLKDPQKYIAQEIEQDAVAFEEAMLQLILEDPSITIDIDSNREDIVDSIHKKASKLYNQYKYKFKKISSNLINN